MENLFVFYIFMFLWKLNYQKKKKISGKVCFKRIGCRNMLMSQQFLVCCMWFCWKKKNGKDIINIMRWENIPFC